MCIRSLSSKYKLIHLIKGKTNIWYNVTDADIMQMHYKNSENLYMLRFNLGHCYTDYSTIGPFLVFTYQNYR